jgi:hypothetical protein
MCLFVIGEDEGFVTLKCFGEITSWNPESELWMWQVRGKSMVWARGWFLAWGELVKVFTPMASGYGLKWPTERPHVRNDRTVFKLIEADASATSARSRGNDIQDRKRHGKMERSVGVGNGTSRASEGRMSFCAL